MFRLVAIAALAVLAAASDPSAAAAQTMVSQCGTEYSGAGVLTGNLDCSGTEEAAITIGDHGSLDLMGFTITADTGVICHTRVPCTVKSSVPGGTVLASATPFWGLWQLGDAGMIVRGVRVDGFEVGISLNSGRGSLLLEDSVVTHTALRAVQVTEAARIERSSVSENEGDGTHSKTLRIVDSEITANGGVGISTNGLNLNRTVVAGNGASGIFAAWGPHRIRFGDVSRNGGHGVEAGGYIRGISISDSMFDDNGGSGVHGFKSIKAVRSTFSGNDGAGMLQFYEWEDSSGIRLKDSTISGNGTHGAAQEPGVFRRLSLKRTTVTANAASLDCGVSIACADLSSPVSPKLDRSSACGTSHVYDSGIPGQTWEVCSND